MLAAVSARSCGDVVAQIVRVNKASNANTSAAAAARTECHHRTTPTSSDLSRPNGTSGWVINAVTGAGSAGGTSRPLKPRQS
jgi:hypothetical protein